MHNLVHEVRAEPIQDRLWENLKKRRLDSDGTTNAKRNKGKRNEDYAE